MYVLYFLLVASAVSALSAVFADFVVSVVSACEVCAWGTAFWHSPGADSARKRTRSAHGESAHWAPYMTNSRSELRTKGHAERNSQDKGHGPPTAEAVALPNVPNVHLGDPIIAAYRSGFRPGADPEAGTPRPPKTPKPGRNF